MSNRSCWSAPPDRSIVVLALALPGCDRAPETRLADDEVPRDTGAASAGEAPGAVPAARSDLEVRPALTTEDDPIATSTTSFGTVSIRGFAWRLGLFLRFQ